MTRRSGWILVTLGLFLALGAGALVYVTLQQQADQARQKALEEARAQVVSEQQTVDLAVAVRPIEPGRPIVAGDFELRPFPADLVPSSAITNTADLENRVLLRPVGQNEMLLRSQLLGESGTALSQEIRPGFVLFAFPLVDLMTQSDLVQDGDRIDLLLTVPPTTLPDGTATTRVTALTLQNIEVFKVLRPVDDEGNKGAPTALLCNMTPADALMLKFIKDSGGTIDFALRSPLDVDPFQADPVDDITFNGRYLQSR